MILSTKPSEWLKDHGNLGNICPEKEKEEARKQNRERVQKCRKRKLLDKEKQVRSRDESINSKIGLIGTKEEIKEEYEQVLCT